VLIQVFSFQLGPVPVLNASPIQSLILPVSTLATPIAAPLAQVLIRSIDEVSAQPFVAVSRARGASTWWLLWRTVARNALLPTLTMAGLLFGELVGGAVVAETVFARMGIRQLRARCRRRPAGHRPAARPARRRPRHPRPDRRGGAVHGRVRADQPDRGSPLPGPGRQAAARRRHGPHPQSDGDRPISTHSQAQT